jgi:hypothetical protein
VLDDRDRATSHEVQNQFLADDPGFVQTFDNRPQAPFGPGAPAGPTAQRRRTQTMFMWIAAPLCMLLSPAAAGPTGRALLLGMSAVAVLVLLYRRCGTTGTDGAQWPWH